MYCFLACLKRDIASSVSSIILLKIVCAIDPEFDFFPAPIFMCLLVDIVNVIKPPLCFIDNFPMKGSPDGVVTYLCFHTEWVGKDSEHLSLDPIEAET